MHLHSIVLDGFRSLDTTVVFAHPLSVVVGANNAGKSNLVDALRTVLWPADGPRARRWITVEDFAHNAEGERQRDDFSIEVRFGGLSSTDEALLVTCLSPQLGKGFARLRLRANLAPHGKVHTTLTGGDADGEPDRLAREAVQFAYLPPLRDAARDLRPGPANRVAHLLRARVPEGHADRGEMERIVGDANRDLDAVASMLQAETTIAEHLGAMSSPAFAQPSDLRFAPAKFEAIIRQLSAHAGEIAALDLDRNGLGFNNLLYMATLLSSLQGDTDALLTVLLVEEPEAHLHPQLQDLLMRFLENPQAALTRERQRRAAAAPSPDGDPVVQSIVTSHSPNFAAAAGAERVTVLSRTNQAKTVARAPHTFGLEDRDLAHLRRYLDVTKASLLFARGVILVEGIAEQLLVPALASQMGMPLHERGVTVINVDGLAFAPFVELFATDRLPIPCALITDGDLDDGTDGEDPTLSASTQSLINRVADWPSVEIFHNEHTLEIELAKHGEWDVLTDALAAIHKQVARKLRAAHTDSPGEVRGDALLAALDRNRAKGRFAQALVAVLGGSAQLTPPPYLAAAIRFACRA